MKGLSLQTEVIFEQISKLECIKDYTLIGGTALSLQLGHRLSEDLNFCLLQKSSQFFVGISATTQGKHTFYSLPLTSHCKHNKN